MTVTTQFLPGMRVVIRDEEWILRRVDPSSDGGFVLSCDGISELVRGTSSRFLSRLEHQFSPIQILDPGETELEVDTSPGFRRALLYAETCLRRTPPNDTRIHVAHKAAMDLLPFQLQPALQALGRPRPRILIADAVGLGKTLEAGILVTELIHRGKGKRILVLSLKSMLSQFQKEFWNRFSIPLTRLDSQGLMRVRNRIPTNHNPFYYYDKAIISIDTLKHNLEYRAYLEGARWDIIIIDEAHNVAERGSRSQRARLARLLATRSDTLIMLSATPHDGKARSFASLINMLDPTAISDPESYSADDYNNKGLVVRRFKKDIKDQVSESFRERKIIRLDQHRASPAEEAVYEALTAVPFAAARGNRSLVRVTLQKALFSSPNAARHSVGERTAGTTRRLEGETDPEKRARLAAELDGLADLSRALAAITPENFSRYQALLSHLTSAEYGWNKRDAGDRLVIFTERVQTLDFLAQHLKRDLKLKDKQVRIMKGSEISDMELQATVEAFGRADDPVRLLLCTDVASEGINLHFHCFRLIHFDLPWSLISFQQRNGRVDRYGQKHRPLITYLCTQVAHPTLQGDQRILEVLITKDQKAYEDIGDPRVFMKVHSVEEEERITLNWMAEGKDATHFDQTYNGEADETESAFQLFLEDLNTPLQTTPTLADPLAQIAEPAGLFPTDAAYMHAALQELHQHDPSLSFTWETDRQSVVLTMPEDLQARFRHFPPELFPADKRLALTRHLERIHEAVAESRRDENSWPQTHYLWAQHPVLQWLDDRMAANFGRHTAPVLTMGAPLADGETTFVINAMVPNRKGHPLVQQSYGIVFQEDTCLRTEPFAETAERLRLREAHPNPASPIQQPRLRRLLTEAVSTANSQIKRHMVGRLQGFQERIAAREAELNAMQVRHAEAFDSRLERQRFTQDVAERRRRDHRQYLQDVFDESRRYVHDVFSCADPGRIEPFLQVIAVFHHP